MHSMATTGSVAQPPGRERSRSRGSGRKELEVNAAGRVRVCHLEVPHFQVVPGQLLGPDRRYFVRRLLGEGTFGRVLSCIDTAQKQAVAVKVVKGVRRYCDFAEAEAEVLREIQRCDPGNQSRCVRLLDTFVHPTLHYCLVFERLGASLHDFMAKGCEQGLLCADVKAIALQLIQCISFLHGLNLSHTDLKCRNVMLRNPRYEMVALPRAKGKGPPSQTRKPSCNEVVVIDFGGALFAAERGDGKVGTRHYRAPEVIVGLPWNEKVDVWSVGCMIALTYLGYRPIGANEDLEQLALMEKFLGREFPRPIARTALSRGTVPGSGAMFNKAGRLEWPKRAPDSDAVERVERARPLRETINAQHRPLLELLEGMLQIDPERRLSAEAASDMNFVASEVDLPE